MRIPTTFLISFLCAGALIVAPGARAASVQELLSEAQTAYMRGDTETAKRNFELVKRMDPNNPTATGYLRLIQAQAAKGGNNATTQERQLANLMVPKVELREATLGSVLDYLRQTASKLSDGKIAVNFVVQLPEEQVKTQAVTLSITNVPFSEVLKYIGSLAGIRFEYDRYAIMVKPAGGASAAAAGGAAAVGQ